MVEKARQHEVVSREDTSMERRVLAAFLTILASRTGESNRLLIVRMKRTDSAFIDWITSSSPTAGIDKKSPSMRRKLGLMAPNITSGRQLIVGRSKC